MHHVVYIYIYIYITGIHDRNFIIPLVFTSGAVATYHSIAPEFILVFSRICVGHSSFLYSDWFTTVLSSYLHFSPFYWLFF